MVKMLPGRFIARGSCARSTNFLGNRATCTSTDKHWLHTCQAPTKFALSATRESHAGYSVSWELETLLSLGSRYDLFQFLKRSTPSKPFLNEIDLILSDRDPRVQLNFPRLLAVADLYCWNSNSRGMDNVRKFAGRKYVEEYNEHGMLNANASLCENIDEPLKAMDIQMAMASQGAWPLVSVLAQVELLLNKVLLCRSRAVVNKVYDFVRDFHCPDLTGPLLCSTWLSFFTSPYRSDWKLADDLLEANEEKMLPHLDSSLPRLADHLLDGRQLNRYCVLLQSFSKSSHRQRTKKLIERLFLHFYTVNNIKGCTSCIRLSQDLKLQLSPDIMYKYETIKKILPQRMSVSLSMTYRF